MLAPADLSNVDAMKSIASDLVGQLDVDSGDTRVGYVLLMAGAFRLSDQATTAKVQSAIESSGFRGRAPRSRPRMDFALAYVRTILLSERAGQRADVPNVVLVLTDGTSGFPRRTQVRT